MANGSSKLTAVAARAARAATAASNARGTPPSRIPIRSVSSSAQEVATQSGSRVQQRINVTSRSGFISQRVQNQNISTIVQQRGIHAAVPSLIQQTRSLSTTASLTSNRQPTLSQKIEKLNQKIEDKNLELEELLEKGSVQKAEKFNREIERLERKRNQLEKQKLANVRYQPPQRGDLAARVSHPKSISAQGQVKASADKAFIRQKTQSNRAHAMIIRVLSLLDSLPAELSAEQYQMYANLMVTADEQINNIDNVSILHKRSLSHQQKAELIALRVEFKARFNQLEGWLNKVTILDKKAFKSKIRSEIKDLVTERDLILSSMPVFRREGTYKRAILATMEPLIADLSDVLSSIKSVDQLDVNNSAQLQQNLNLMGKAEKINAEITRLTEKLTALEKLQQLNLKIKSLEGNLKHLDQDETELDRHLDLDLDKKANMERLSKKIIFDRKEEEKYLHRHKLNLVQKIEKSTIKEDDEES